MAATAGLGDQRQELRDVVVVHRVHGGEVRAGDAALQAEALRLVGERLDVARQRIVGLVAMHVDAQAALGGDLAQRRPTPRRPRPSCARNAGCRRRRRRPCRARARGSRPRPGAVVAVLREGDELQVEIGRDPALHLEQRVDGEQPVVADVDMAADGEQALRRRPGRNSAAPARSPPRAVRSGFSSPHSAMPSSSVPDSLSAGRPSESVASMWKWHVDERRRDEAAAGVDLGRPRPVDAPARWRRCVRPDGDVEAGAAVGQGGVADDQVEGHGACGYPRA